jgi:hypothetical protein
MRRKARLNKRWFQIEFCCEKTSLRKARAVTRWYGLFCLDGLPARVTGKIPLSPLYEETAARGGRVFSSDGFKPVFEDREHKFINSGPRELWNKNELSGMSI